MTADSGRFKDVILLCDFACLFVCFCGDLNSFGFTYFERDPKYSSFCEHSKTFIQFLNVPKDGTPNQCPSVRSDGQTDGKSAGQRQKQYPICYRRGTNFVKTKCTSQTEIGVTR